MKGIILAGGSGTRLFPITKVISKQLIPIYDKPMIYYPLSTLMLAGIRDILIISTPEDISRYEDLLGDGSPIGLRLSYKIQPSPDGLAQAFILGESFIESDDVCLILGDNVFYGKGLPEHLKKCVKEVEVNQNAVVFGYYVNDPERYGVVNFDDNENAITIEEKPINPKTGLPYTLKEYTDLTAGQKGKLLNRARHVISENKRVQICLSALQNNDSKTFGNEMFESHISLSKDYEVSSELLDNIIKKAKLLKVIGGRLTGAGFGGCCVFLTEKESSKNIFKFLKEDFKNLSLVDII